jgi:triosephosphate isomerase
LDKTEWKKVIIAYEPIWALNTGKIASSDQVHEAIVMIRQWLQANTSEQIASSTRILYGGPVTESNTDKLIELPGVDGFLVGSTSCKPVFRNIFDMVHAQAEKDLPNKK